MTYISTEDFGNKKVSRKWRICERGILMKKIALALAAVLSMSIVVPVYAGIGISIDGKPVDFTDSTGSPMIDENDKTLVPLRATMEAFGCVVNWNESAKTAIVEKDGTVVTLVVGDASMYVNGVRKANDSMPQIIAGRVYLPIRAVLEAFGASVNWDEKTNSISVASSEEKDKPEKNQKETESYYDDIYINDDGELVFKSSDGKEINVGKVTGEKGRRVSSGSDGVSVTDAYIDNSGDLIIVLSDGDEINAGSVSTSTAKTFEDYDVGDKWDLSYPDGEFTVDVQFEDAEYTIYFEEIYYELTAKNDFDDDNAWKKEHERREASTLFVPYEVTMNISGYTDPALSGSHMSVSLYDIKDSKAWGYTTTIDNNGEFRIELTQGKDRNDNVWYKPAELYFRSVYIEKENTSDNDD